MSAWRLGGACALAGAVFVVCAQAPAPGPSAHAPAPAPAPRIASLPGAEVFFRNPDVVQAELSPSGTRLAVSTAVGAQRTGLVVFDLGPQAQVTRAALFTDVDVVRFEWVDDDRLVFSVADLASGSGADRTEAPGLYAVDADGSNLRQLVSRRSDGVVESAPLRQRALNWNHLLLSVPAPRDGVRNEDIVVGAVVFDGSNGVRQINPLWLNVRSGRTRPMDLRPPGDTVAWLFDSAGQPRVAVTRRGGRQAVHWLGPGQAEWKLLAEADGLRLPFTPRFVDDAGNLYVTHRQGPDGLDVLARYDFERQAPAAEPWVSVAGFDFSGDVIGGRQGAAALGVRVEADAETTVWFNAAMQRMQQRADELLPGRVNRLSCRRCGDSDMVVLVRSWSDRDPGQLWLYRQAGAQWQMVARVLQGVEPADMARVEFERIKARDGRDLPLWLTLPPGHGRGEPRPAVVLVHGGPWVRGGHWRWSAMEQFLASRGYLVISPDFRGSLGYGQAHFKAGWKQWGRAMQDDVADALLWAQAQGLADARACIAGASYGGYSALMGLARHPGLYRCGIAWVAVTDLVLLLDGSVWVRDDISDGGRRYTLPDLVGDVRVDAEALRAVSPVALADRIRAPLLLAFGESDLRVPLAHGDRLREALRKAGREPLWVSYPGEGHYWRLPQTRVDFAQRVERFLAQHLGDAPK